MKNNISKYGITLLSLIVLFFVSFSTSAWIYIKSNDLVFTDTVEEYEEKYKKVTETEERIVELEEQIKRYKSMYEGAIKDNKILSSTVSTEVNNVKNTNTKTEKEEIKKTEDDLETEKEPEISGDKDENKETEDKTIVKTEEKDKISVEKEED